ncbi:hypothetical protein [Dyadobacter psychrotolerans]|uniref:Outer membrane protein beta-barrel domain-containing protein n=1 Tax=Dyadobacter psychrotolerans TaxID=2541721 RepID=A0A4R5E0G9_9BACT|nr:hypothetical protein [Dyadobacter psychrotolerans]TDE18504.1 hypothetical protein E0F88_02910 [Dyadobacter psychrotolerans]
MKIYLPITLLTFLCLSDPVQAQVQKGTKYLAATISFDGYNFRPSGYAVQQTVSSQFTISPFLQAGKFFKDNRMAGIGLGSSNYIFSVSNNDGQNISKNRQSRNAYTLAPYVRHYKPLNTKWAVFLNTSAEISFLSLRYKANGSRESDNGYGVGVKVVPGISFWVTPRFALESDINLLSLGVSYSDIVDVKSINFNSAVTTNLNSYFSVRASWYIHRPQ